MPPQYGDITKNPTNQALTNGQISRIDRSRVGGMIENQNKNKFCEFYGDKGHNTNECIHLRKQIEEAVKEISWPLRQISLMVSLGDGEPSTSTMMNFMIVRSPSSYNGIIGRLRLQKIQVVPSTTHGRFKFLVRNGIIMLHSNTVVPIECKTIAKPPTKLPPNALPTEAGIKITIHPEYPEQPITIGVSLSEKGRNQSISRKGRGYYKNTIPKNNEGSTKPKWKGSKPKKEMKQCIAELPMLTEPKLIEELIMYLCAAREVPRSKNKKADALSKIAYTSFTHLTKQVLVQVLKEKSIKEKEILAIIEKEGYSCMTPLLKYL
nr:reverse transcriptase domain-containing protein [Tanacetum cinerariifolium]